MPEFEVVVVYSGISNDLISTDFNNRVDECCVAGWLFQDLGNLEVIRLDEVRLRNIPVKVYKEYREQLITRSFPETGRSLLQRAGAGVERCRILGARGSRKIR